MKDQKYYTVLQRSDIDGLFHIQYGSYDKSEAQYELDDIRRSEGVPVKDMRIITTEPRQCAIDAEVQRINASINATEPLAISAIADCDQH